ncbi:MAG TPA: protein-disulfide reductase DsbD domain-containing protein [Gemmatimonadales bacterium]|nr:protein-disulfide reductase DsbD domain-containing protein [Gemmatimonadales bacterium]
MLIALALLQAFVTKPHVTISVVPELTAIVAGMPQRVALRFQVEPGWHVYWKNPGESGVATTASWKLPTGFTVDSLSYPTPARLDVAGTVTHVLDGDVVFEATIRPPARISSRDSRLTTRVFYGICKNACYPGQASLSVTMPVRTDASRTMTWHAADSVFQSRRPRTTGITAGFTWKGDRGVLSVLVPPGCKGDSVTFFPEDRDLSPAAVTVPMPRGCGPAQFTIPLREKPKAGLRGVVVIGTGPRGYEVGK